MRDVQLGYLALAIGILTPACAGPIINTAAPEPVARISAPPDTTLLVGRLVIPRESLAVGTAAAVTQSFQAGDVRLHEMERELNALLGRSGPRVLSERDVGGQPPPAHTFVLRLEVTSLTENVAAAPEMVACIVIGSFTAGIGYLPCIDTRNTTTHTFDVDARLYDASGAAIERVTRDGEIELVVDTSERQPLLRESYRIEMQSGLHSMSGPPTGPDGERFIREQGARMAQLAYDHIAPDVARAIARAPAPQAVEATPATSGGEVLSAPEHNGPTGPL